MGERSHERGHRLRQKLYRMTKVRGLEASTKLLLASKRADPGSKDKNGESPLSWAAELGHVSTLQAMLDKGADPNIPNASSQTPLSLAARNGRATVTELLLANNKVNPVSVLF